MNGLKKKEVLIAENPKSCFHLDVTDKNSIDELKSSYRNESYPFQHIVLKNIFEPNLLRMVKEEMINNLRANYKETDLFKLFQTDELGNLKNEDKKLMKNLVKVRDAIYSKEFRNYITAITGCEVLTDRVDCSANIYTNGCHLLCHDDVIGTRSVSYIIYLSDSDINYPWLESYGGAVELYPLEKAFQMKSEAKEDPKAQGIPTANPTKCILPLFNSMLIFHVQPGRSYHSVQEVFNKELPRLSISGWYHSAQPPLGSDKASLNQIMSKGDNEKPFQAIYPLISSMNEQIIFSKEEILELKMWINPKYLSEKMMDDINDQFCDESSLQLNDFLREDIVRTLYRYMILTDKNENIGNGIPQLDYNKGIDDQYWKVVGPSHKRRYLEYCVDNDSDGRQSEMDECILKDLFKTKSKKDYRKYLSDQHSGISIGMILNLIRKYLFESSTFAKYLHHITALQPVAYRNEIRRFRAGLDYTVAHYGVLTKEAKLDATLCFVNDNENLAKDLIENKKRKNQDLDDENSDLWNSGDVGGFECYISVDEDAEGVEAAEVYRQKVKKNQNGENIDDANTDDDVLLSISPANNILSLVMRDENIMKFIKYVSANAPSSRWDISVEYDIVAN